MIFFKQPECVKSRLELIHFLGDGTPNPDKWEAAFFRPRVPDARSAWKLCGSASCQRFRTSDISDAALAMAREISAFQFLLTN